MRETINRCLRYAWIGASIAALVYFLWSTLPVLHDGMFDFSAYLRAGHAVLVGLNPYFINLQPGQAAFLYPPVVAIAMAPIALAPVSIASALWYFFSLACLVLGCALTCVVENESREIDIVTEVAATTAISLLFYPVWTNAKLGQINSLTFLLAVGSLYSLQKRRPVLAGLLIGLASSIKLIPLIILVYAVLARQRTYVLVGGSVFLFLQALPTLWFPGLVSDYWLIVAPSTASSHPESISLVNLIRTVTQINDGPLLWLGVVLAVTSLSIPLVRGAHGGTFSILDIAMLLTATAIFGPLVESHHLVWLILPLWILAQEFVRSRNVLGLCCWLIAFVMLSQPFRVARALEHYMSFTLPPETLQGGVVLQSGTVCLYLMLLAVAFVRSRRQQNLSGMLLEGSTTPAKISGSRVS